MCASGGVGFCVYLCVRLCVRLCALVVYGGFCVLVVWGFVSICVRLCVLGSVCWFLCGFYGGM